MTRGTGSSLTTPFRSTAGARPVWLVRIATGMVAPTVLRYHDAAQMEPITFGGESYTARAIDIPDQRLEAAIEGREVAVRVADPDGVLAGYVTAGNDFARQRVILRLTDFAVIEASGSDAIRSDYFVEAPLLEEGAVTFLLRPLASVFGIETPRRVLTRSMFPGLPPSGINA